MWLRLLNKWPMPLWFKLLLHELTAVRDLLLDHGRDADAMWQARHLLSRVTRIEQVLIAQLPVLETMTPQDFLVNTRYIGEWETRVRNIVIAHSRDAVLRESGAVRLADAEIHGELGEVLAGTVAVPRDATTIFMASGPGGCEVYGLAVTLKRRGLDPEIHISRGGPYFLGTVKSADKRREITAAELGALLSGIDLSQAKRRKRYQRCIAEAV